MFGLLKKLLVCLILLSSVSSYGQTLESPKKQAASSKEAAKQPTQDTKQAIPAVKIAPPSETDQKTKQVPEKDSNHPTPDWWLILVTGLLVVATGGLVYYARDTARRQLRAYISVTGAERIDGDPHFGFRIDFKNAGQTPAYDLVSGARCDIAPFPDAGVMKEVPLTHRSRSTIGPGVNTHLFPTRTNLTTAESEAMDKGTAGIYIHGRIEYRDAFNRGSSADPRVTWFRLVYRKTQASNYIIGNDREGNDAT